MSFDATVVHFKHCRVACAVPNIDFEFQGAPYLLVLSSSEFDTNKGALVRRTDGSPSDSELLVWLSVYFGEDFVDPRQTMDTRQCHNRGLFQLKVEHLKRFLKSVERALGKRQAKWKKRLFDDAVRYYSVALRSGLNMMPLTIGFFGMSMECVGNYVYGNKSSYMTLGNFSFNKLINMRFKRYKSMPKLRDFTKKWQKYIKADASLVHNIRNAYYGHSLLHLAKDRKSLATELKDWLVRAGYSKRDADFWIKPHRLDMDIQIQAAPLYKVGLRSARLLIFLLLGFSRSIPFAEYDYLPFSPLPKGESMKFDGMTVTVLDQASSELTDGRCPGRS